MFEMIWKTSCHDIQFLSFRITVKNRQWNRNGRFSSSLAALKEELTSRKLPLLYDYPTRMQTYLLRETLVDFLPAFNRESVVNGRRVKTLPFAHHLMQFPPANPLSMLTADGTDPAQSPGPPFVRRMWAGGTIYLPLPGGDGKAGFCLERIVDVKIAGNTSEDEKLFVTLERRIPNFQLLPQTERGRSKKSLLQSYTEDELREMLSQNDHVAKGIPGMVIEERNLVFLQETKGKVTQSPVAAVRKVVKPPHEPTFSHSLTPTAALLFRFSALTFNAHKIHLDKEYCRDVEGYRNLIVHGPLSLMLMVELLQRQLEIEGRTTEGIAKVEYRNLAPLYAEEELRICGRQRGPNVFDVWIEGAGGVYAVKGTVTTAEVDRSSFFRSGIRYTTN